MEIFIYSKSSFSSYCNGRRVTNPRTRSTSNLRGGFCVVVVPSVPSVALVTFHRERERMVPTQTHKHPLPTSTICVRAQISSGKPRTHPPTYSGCQSNRPARRTTQFSPIRVRSHSDSRPRFLGVFDTHIHTQLMTVAYYKTGSIGFVTSVLL